MLCDKNGGFYQSRKSIECRQRIEDMPTSEEIASAVHSVLAEKFGVMNASAICVANRDCVHLLGLYEELLQERSELIDMNDRFESVYRRIDSIDSLMRDVCRFIPQLTKHAEVPATSKVPALIEKTVDSIVGKKRSRSKIQPK